MAISLQLWKMKKTKDGWLHWIFCTFSHQLQVIAVTGWSHRWQNSLKVANFRLIYKHGQTTNTLQPVCTDLQSMYSQWETRLSWLFFAYITARMPSTYVTLQLNCHPAATIWLIVKEFLNFHLKSELLVRLFHTYFCVCMLQEICNKLW